MISNVGERLYYDGNAYINKNVWEYMCKDNVTFDKAIEALNLNYKDAVANERTFQI